MVAVDDVDGCIELQYFDGTVDEADPERWLALRPSQVEPPEDWSGSVDIEYVDLPYVRPRYRIDWERQLDAQDFSEAPDDFEIV